VTTKSTEPDVFLATTSGVCNIDGVEYRFFAGKTRVRAGHPLLRGRRECFEPDVFRIDYDWPPSRR
jgi:hypothetical protein